MVTPMNRLLSSTWLMYTFQLCCPLATHSVPSTVA